jgi:cytoskeletal protein RodZ
MSLINDALKQAKAAQSATPTAAGPTLKPVEQARRSGGSGILLPIVILLVLLLAGILLWQWFNGQGAIKVRAKTVDSSTQAASPMVVASIAPTPVAAVPAPVEPAPVQKEAAPASAPAVTNVVTVEQPKPQPPTYKLQGIFYRHKGSSAVINGRTVWVGQRVGEARVTAIEQETVTLALSDGTTKVLESPQ